jgi:hypothetical protein
LTTINKIYGNLRLCLSCRKDITFNILYGLYTNPKDRVIVLGDVSHVTKGFMCRVKRPKVEGITKIRANMR